MSEFDPSLSDRSHVAKEVAVVDPAAEVSPEEALIRRYFDAFNRHDIEGVMACFHDEPLLVDGQGARHEGRAALRRHYERRFATFTDGRCELGLVTGRAGRGMAESRFVGTQASSGRSVAAIGAEVIEFDGGRIKAIRDYHRLTPEPS